MPEKEEPATPLQRRNSTIRSSRESKLVTEVYDTMNTMHQSISDQISNLNHRKSKTIKELRGLQASVE